MRILHGKPISPGYARGLAFVYSKDYHPKVDRYNIEKEQVYNEYQRFHEALERSCSELKDLRQKVFNELGHSESQIFAAHLGLLNDRQFISKVKERIERDLINVEHAIDEEVNDLVKLLSELENEYLRERASDMKDIGRRVLKHLGHGHENILKSIKSGSVLVAEELLPSDTLNMDRGHISAIVTEFGGDTSHSAILARSLGIPAITGIINVCSNVSDGVELLVDGETGTVTIAADEEDLGRFDAEKKEYERVTSDAEAAEETKCITLDGVGITLLANIGRLEEVTEIKRHNLDGIGLFRTECLFLQSGKPPTMEEQLSAYTQVADTLPDMPVNIRTLDLGGDKKPHFLSSKFQHNPNLGARGLRFSLLEKELLQTQLQAITKANRHGNVKVLFPMVMGGFDLRKAVEWLHAAKEEVKADRTPEIGAMIETPSALFELEEILQFADFLSIGTNDLAQFILAADRNATDLLSDDSVLQPSVLRAIDKTIKLANKKNRPVCICGEAAGNPTIACLFAGLGIRQMSMSPVRAARVRYVLSKCKANDLENLANKALRSESPEQIVSLTKEFAEEIFKTF